MEIDELKYWVAFSCFQKFGPVRFNKIISHFGSARNGFCASKQELSSLGLPDNLVEEFIEKRGFINPDKEWERLKKENIQIITINDSNYPRLLKEIYDPPPLLYCKGNLNANNDFSIAVVGSRKISAYGRQATPKITEALAENGITIVSGMALGIDTLAHESALKKGGKTIAVLGSGIDSQSLYPCANHGLAKKIIETGGAVISEFPLGTPGLKQNFPFRNRIISGLSLGVVVIEAAEDSGSLITARAALEQNREVFALPGNIFDPNSQGTNNLIKMGAHPIASAIDILNILNLEKAATFKDNIKIIPESAEEAKILEILNHEPSHIDKIAIQTNLDIKTASSTLTLMEMKGIVRDIGGLNYVLAR